MEQALGPRGLSTPDVIKSALNKNEAAGAKINTNAIDNLFGAPDKIVIPERYVPDVVSITIPQIRDEFGPRPGPAWPGPGLT